MDYSINSQPVNPAKELFTAIALHPNADDILTIASRPRVSKVKSLKQRQSKTERCTLGQVAGNKLPEGYQYMMTIRTNAFLQWSMRELLDKYLALKGLQVVTQYRDDNEEVKPIVFEPFTSDRGDQLTTIYITTKDNAIGDFED